MDEDRMITDINQIIDACITYGGDHSGPYCTYPKSLKYAIENFLEHACLNKKYRVKFEHEPEEMGYVIITKIKDNSGDNQKSK